MATLYFFGTPTGEGRPEMRLGASERRESRQGKGKMEKNGKWESWPLNLIAVNGFPLSKSGEDDASTLSARFDSIDYRHPIRRALRRVRSIVWVAVQHWPAGWAAEISTDIWPFALCDLSRFSLQVILFCFAWSWSLFFFFPPNLHGKVSSASVITGLTSPRNTPCLPASSDYYKAPRRRRISFIA